MIIESDCIEYMSKMDDKSIDMILCDLPYGTSQNEKDIVIPFNTLWEQYNRIIKDNGCIALFAQGLFYIDLVQSNRKYFRYDLVWDKVLTSGFLNAKRMPLRSHEQIAIFYKKQPVYNPQFTIGKPQHGMGKKYLNERKNNNYGEFKSIEDDREGETQKYPKSILTFQKPHSSIAKHRTEKSVECLEWLIKTYTNENDLVLDNCAGSGTVGLACEKVNRRYILVDNDPVYCMLMKLRLNK
jgi:site-specific DNA-methyltransferase (adenine-specific)